MPKLAAQGYAVRTGPDQVKFTFTSPVEISLREPEGGFETVEFQFHSGLAVAELDHRGACCLWLPPDRLEVNIDFDPWHGFLAAPTLEKLASALSHAGAPDEAVRLVRDNVKLRAERGRPPELNPFQQLVRLWQMKLEVIWLRLKGLKRPDAAAKVAEWHGRRTNYVLQQVGSTDQYDQFARIRNMTTGSKSV